MFYYSNISIVNFFNCFIFSSALPLISSRILHRDSEVYTAHSFFSIHLKRIFFFKFLLIKTNLFFPEVSVCFHSERSVFIMGRLIVWLICLTVVTHMVQPAAIFNRDSKFQYKVDKSNLVDQQDYVSHAILDFSEYEEKRKDLLNSEMVNGFASDILLNEKEEMANKIIMKAKEDELNVGFQTPHLFNPSQHIFAVFDAVKKSKLFQMIQKMPKGGILHAHEMALCSTDYVVSLTYWPDLWQRTSNKTNEIVEFKFSREQPKSEKNTSNSVWRRVVDVRNEMGATIYDEHVHSLFTLFDKNVDPRIQFKDINDVWQRFTAIFMKIAPILRYVPVRKAYYEQALKELQDDGVQYLEFRGSVSKVLHSKYLLFTDFYAAILFFSNSLSIF